jgi:hypothetical protein
MVRKRHQADADDLPDDWLNVYDPYTVRSAMVGDRRDAQLSRQRARTCTQTIV